MNASEAVFWAAVAFVAYTYVGYPLLIHLLARRRPGETGPLAEPAHWPTVAVVVAVHNEERRIAAKLANLRALDYPPDQLRIVFVSDGSTDGTNAMLEQAEDVRLLTYPVRQGKPSALNFALARIDADVVVFTDARQSLARDAVKCLVARLLQPGIGAVSGELVHGDPQSSDSANVGLYWRYEKWIRQSESRYLSTIGVTGALYAIRREHFSAIPADTLLDDVEIPLRILRRGLRVVFEGRARVHDELQTGASGERRRKVRTLAGNFQAFARNPWLFSPRENPVFVQFLSHKVFRLMVPYALAAALVASMLADGLLYRCAAAAQLAFYAMPLAAAVVPGLRDTRLVSFVAVFLELNWAAVLGLVSFLRGRSDVRWERT